MEKQVGEECFCVNGFSAQNEQKACPQFAHVPSSPQFAPNTVRVKAGRL
jgi:hypothetical protein